MLTFKEYIRKPSLVVSALLKKYGYWIPDRMYLKMLYRCEVGEKLNLKNPISFCEKLQWLKLYDRSPEYTMLVDKLAVKDRVSELIGTEYIIPTLGSWNRPEQIDWSSLPDRFVLKTTHGGGSKGVVICRDKKTMDIQEASNKLNRSLKSDGYHRWREWPYKNVPRKIIAEKYIDPSPDRSDLTDYKWFCFNGEPKYCQVIQNRSTMETIDFFDATWRHQEFVGLNPVAKQAAIEPAPPHLLEIQTAIAHKLSAGIPFVRVDLYETGDKVYFGEMTFYPMSGMGKFRPAKYNDLLGEMLILPLENDVR